MTTSMIFWSIVAILALIGLAYLLTRKELKAESGGPRERAPVFDNAILADTFIQAGEPVMDRKPKFEVYKAKKGYRWRLLSANGRTLCSGESHTRARDAARAARTVIETAAIADVVHASRPGH